MPDQTDLAYAAGIIDGEGSIVVGRHPSKSCRRGFSFDLSVQVLMTDWEVPSWLHLNFGGCFFEQPPRKGMKRRRLYGWRLYSINAQHFLELALPYLKIKRLQAELATEFQKLKAKRGEYHRYSPKPAALLEAEDILAEQVRELNQRS